MIQQIFPRQGERGGFSTSPTRPGWTTKEVKSPSKARSRELRATCTTGVVAARRADRDDEDREAARAQIAMAIART